jgi:hypothetical protein
MAAKKNGSIGTTLPDFGMQANAGKRMLTNLQPSLPRIAYIRCYLLLLYIRNESELLKFQIL